MLQDLIRQVVVQVSGRPIVPLKLEVRTEKFPRTVGKDPQTYASYHPRSTKPSAAQRRKPHVSRSFISYCSWSLFVCL